MSRRRGKPHTRPSSLASHAARPADSSTGVIAAVVASAARGCCAFCGSVGLAWADVAGAIAIARTPTQRAAFFDALTRFAAGEWAAWWCLSCEAVGIAEGADPLF